MSFHWLQQRITEEKERRLREKQIRERIPKALEELDGMLRPCIQSYREAFGTDSADISTRPSGIHIMVRHEQDGKWKSSAEIDIASDLALPGFRVDRGGSSLLIEVGMLAGEKMFYRDRELDQYLTMEEMTRRILDRAFFPKLGE